MTPHPQRCSPLDIDAISQFLDKEKELFFYSKTTIKRMVLGDDEGRKPYDIFLEKIDNKIVGIAIVSSKSKTLSLLFVSPEYRKQGIGAALFQLANPKQILMKRNAIPYFAQLCGCASHSTAKSEQEIREQVLDDFAQWVKTEWVQESIKDYKAELREQEGKR